MVLSTGDPAPARTRHCIWFSPPAGGRFLNLLRGLLIYPEALLQPSRDQILVLGVTIRRSNMHHLGRQPSRDGARGAEGAVASWPVRCSYVACALSSAGPPLPTVLSPRVADRLPLHVGDCIGAATSEGDDVIFPIAGTGTGRQPGRRAWVLALELACHGP
jgi:hypothetical protein